MFNSLFGILKLFHSCHVSKGAADARIRRGQLDDRKPNPSMFCVDDDEDCCCSSVLITFSSCNIFSSVCVGRSWDFSGPAARCYVDCSFPDFIVGDSYRCR
jgi:hypothetical protein